LRLRAVLLDLGGTLMIEEGSEDLSRGLASSLGIDAPPSYLDVYHGYGFRYADICETSLEAVAYYYVSRSRKGVVRPEEARKTYRDLVRILAASLKPIPGALGALREIRRLADRVVIVSNASSQEAIEEALRIHGFLDHVDAVVTSRLVGVRKPDPRIFIYALSLVDAKPGEAIHIGDRGYEDIWGAKNLGIKTIHIARNTPPSPIADYVANDITQVPTILGKIVNS
jgi:HAD superfamily hydrolase (TIGR01509 family)